MLFLVLVLIVALLTVVFAVANTATVPVSILVAEFQDVSIVLLVVIALLLGVLITYIGMLPAYVRSKRIISGQRKKIIGLEKSMAEQTSKVEQLEQKLNPPAVPVVTPVTGSQPPVESSGNSIDPVI